MSNNAGRQLFRDNKRNINEKYNPYNDRKLSGIHFPLRLGKVDEAYEIGSVE